MDEKRCDILACAQMLTASYSFIYRSEPKTEKIRKNENKNRYSSEEYGPRVKAHGVGPGQEDSLQWLTGKV